MHMQKVKEGFISFVRDLRTVLVYTTAHFSFPVFYKPLMKFF
jgi:hypothetical protein